MRIPPPSLDTPEKTKAIFAEHPTVKGVANAAGCDWHTARAWLDAYGIKRDHSQRKEDARLRNPDWHAKPNCPDLKDFPTDSGAMWDKLIDWQDEVNQWDVSQDEATVEIDTDLPIGIVFRADWHLGNENTDHKLFRQHCRCIADMPGLYDIEAGDLMDGFIKPTMPEGMHEALARPRMQRHLVWDTCNQLRGKVIAVVGGQHDHWGIHQADFDPVEWLGHDMRVPYLGHGGMVKLRVGKVWYSIHVRHLGRYNSVYNATHSIKQWWRFNGDSDVGCHADKHVPAMEFVWWKDEMRIACRPGT